MPPERHPVRGHWLVALLAFSAVVAVGFVAIYLPATRYKASASLLAQPAKSGGLDSTSVSGLQFLLPAVSEQVKARAFREAVRERLASSSLPVGAVGDLQASTVAGSGVIHLSALNRSARAAEAAVNVAAAVLIERKLSPALEITVLKQAELPSSPAYPQRTKTLIAAFVLALIAAVAAAYGASALLDPRRPAALPPERNDVRSSDGAERRTEARTPAERGRALERR